MYIMSALNLEFEGAGISTQSEFQAYTTRSLGPWEVVVELQILRIGVRMQRLDRSNSSTVGPTVM